MEAPIPAIKVSDGSQYEWSVQCQPKERRIYLVVGGEIESCHRDLARQTAPLPTQDACTLTRAHGEVGERQLERY